MLCIAAAGAAAIANPERLGAPIKFRHVDEHAPIVFGTEFPGGRGPSAFLMAEDPSIMKYLKDDPRGPFWGSLEERQESKLWPTWGFEKDEQMWKADWHCMKSPGPAKLFAPRRADVATMQQAPPRIYAFLEVLRAVNADIWSSMAQALQAMKAERSEEACSLIDIFATALEKDSLFGVVEVQVRQGGEHGLPSHKDGATSLLHLGISLSGNRTLRMGRYTRRHSPSTNTHPPIPERLPWKTRKNLMEKQYSEDVWDHCCWHSSNIVDTRMTAGSAYISSPYCIEHAVSYESCDFSNPMIAMQCRFALDALEGERVNDLRDGTMREIAEIVSSHLAAATQRGELRMPSLQEVVAVERRLLQGTIPKTPTVRRARAGNWRRPALPQTALRCEGGALRLLLAAAVAAPICKLAARRSSRR
eukprot:TRINITY_DN41329_c0_g1_i1.p1 TRINITY_DN41329_c0_g1~~TRINITY_DN41329_c0_g1_i1.p1  ORF type:complete len:418 (+),score=63.65 TRINITY_DN41329_c0_g1_i1:64-1317(+)